jgi:hypothetical protein
VLPSVPKEPCARSIRKPGGRLLRLPSNGVRWPYTLSIWKDITEGPRPRPASAGRSPGAGNAGCVAPEPQGGATHQFSPPSPMKVVNSGS